MRFTLLIAPSPKGRARVARGKNFARVYTPSETRRYEARLAGMLRAEMQLAPPLVGPVYCELHFYFEKPRSVRRRLFPSVKPDLDNLIKAVEDAANGIVWRDDAQVVELRAKKLYGHPSRIEMEVYEILEGV